MAANKLFLFRNQITVITTQQRKISRCGLMQSLRAVVKHLTSNKNATLLWYESLTLYSLFNIVFITYTRFEDLNLTDFNYSVIDISHLGSDWHNEFWNVREVFITDQKVKYLEFKDQYNLQYFVIESIIDILHVGGDWHNEYWNAREIHWINIGAIHQCKWLQNIQRSM